MFDISEFKENDIAVLCKTEEIANEFLKILDGYGLTWLDGYSLIDLNNWSDEYEATCYVYFRDFYDSGIRYNAEYFYIEKGYKIIDFSILRSKKKIEDFLNKKEMEG
jgi:hypothetical protein